ncbi:hypothetical protein B296_00022606 [Ensete ventricosum]|uniref:Uncharacterized protein n=1 Tax=Ensete ventricosum TaxID=4639 RepID=A0A426YJX9_ENSVE|nr:hypothetical protein B296_00022606 [Ensete ventricosum]
MWLSKRWWLESGKIIRGHETTNPRDNPREPPEEGMGRSYLLPGLSRSCSTQSERRFSSKSMTKDSLGPLTRSGQRSEVATKEDLPEEHPWTESIPAARSPFGGLESSHLRVGPRSRQVVPVSRRAVSASWLTPPELPPDLPPLTPGGRSPHQVRPGDALPSDARTSAAATAFGSPPSFSLCTSWRRRFTLLSREVITRPAS